MLLKSVYGSQASKMTVQKSCVAEIIPAEEAKAEDQATQCSPSEMTVGLLTGCRDKHYALAIAMGLAGNGVCLDVIGSDEVDSPELHTTPRLRFLNFRGDQRSRTSFARKLSKALIYYAKLVRYAADSEARVLHILWNNKFELFDRTILMLYYKMCGKKIALTAHNVNQARRDAKDSPLNRATLKMQYRLCDHIFVHTQKMKDELCGEYGVAENVVTVIRYPINNAIPETEISPSEAKQRLGLARDERAILFFGRIRPYKGIEHLLDAFRLLVTDTRANYRLIVAGEPKKGAEAYLHEIQQTVTRDFDPGQVILKMDFISDDQMEIYFKGADVLVLPYKEIFQSGVLFLAYSFGLPVVATDVGSFREDIVDGVTGFVCKQADNVDLAKTVQHYFTSDLYRNLVVRRRELVDYANTNYSWNAVANSICNAYAQMLRRKPF